MPSDSYREWKIERLLQDPEYASMCLEYSFSEATRDGFVGGFLISLEDAVEAARRRQGEASEEDILRRQLHHKLNAQENHTVETITSALEEVGLTCEIKPARLGLLDSDYKKSSV